MSLVESIGNFHADFQSLAERQRAAGKTRGERLTLEILHDEIFGAVLVSDVVKSADVGMVERRNGAGFTLEALSQFGVFGEMVGQDFDGDGAVEAGVASAVDLTHAASA